MLYVNLENNKKNVDVQNYISSYQKERKKKKLRYNITALSYK